jgi:hypothetical protein
VHPRPDSGLPCLDDDVHDGGSLDDDVSLDDHDREHVLDHRDSPHADHQHDRPLDTSRDDDHHEHDGTRPGLHTFRPGTLR